MRPTAHDKMEAARLTRVLGFTVTALQVMRDRERQAELRDRERQAGGAREDLKGPGDDQDPA